MTDPLRPLNLDAALAVVAAALKVTSGIPGIVPQQIDGPWVFPEVNALGGNLPNTDATRNTRARIVYDIVSIVGLGWDEWRFPYDPAVVIPGDTYEPDPTDPTKRLGGTVPNDSGNRLVTIQVRCEVQADPGGAAFNYLTKVQTGMYLPSVSASLEAVGFAINDITDIRQADFKDDSGLTVRAAYLEIVFNAADCATDTPLTTIEVLEIDDPTITP